MFIKKTFRRGARAGGFSLVELLLVLSLAPVVFFAVYSNFSAGVNLWRRLQVDVPEEGQAIFRLKTQRDFQNAMRFASMPFSGSTDEVVFTTAVEAHKALGGMRAIGQVRYFYNESARAIFRETRDFSEAYRDASGKMDQMVPNVRALRLSYLVKDALSAEYEWKDEYRPDKPGSIPTAIRLTYWVNGSNEAMEQTFGIPAGGTLK